MASGVRRPSSMAARCLAVSMLAALIVGEAMARGSRPRISSPEVTEASFLEQDQASATFNIDHHSKLIYIDDTNESGQLVGELGMGATQSDDPDDQAQQQAPSLQHHRATNYSVYLISRHKAHIAILVDVEQINFEPIINCEYQELRFSIVGEISKQLLEHDHDNATSGAEEAEDGHQTNQQQPATPEDDTDDDDDQSDPPERQEQQQQQQTSNEQTAVAPLPVSEAMAILLNSPLNKTILDESGENNDFKIIDTTIDYLHDETCQELNQQQQQQLSNDNNNKQQQQHQQQPEQQRQYTRRNKKYGLPNSKDQTQPPRQQRNNNNSNNNDSNNNSSKKSQQQQRKQSHRIGSVPLSTTATSEGRSAGWERNSRARCDQEAPQFKDAMWSKLNQHFEWDDFKIVCGKIRQLVIPMRSLKMSIYSDEFSPQSKFIIRYRFVSDPSLLPALDNGKYYCRNRNVIDLGLKCDGVDDCGDASDESIKICGYPTGASFTTHTSHTNTAAHKQQHNSRNNNNSKQSQNADGSPVNDDTQSMDSTTLGSNRRKLTYVNGDILHCCQSSDWLSVIPSGDHSSPATNLQSLIGESMNLFSGPVFTPTKPKSTNRPRRRLKRIVGGDVAKRGYWPGQASLQYELLEPLCHFCAGTLIHPQYVLTAGHCITKDGLNRGIKVVFGAHDLRQLGGNHVQVRYVDDAQIYPGVDVKHLNFDWENDMNNDIALLRLNAPVLVTQNVAPACLPPFNTPLAVKTACRSIGWGQTHGSGNSNLLKHLNLKVVNSTQCSKELIDRDPTTDESSQQDEQDQQQQNKHASPTSTRAQTQARTSKTVGAKISRAHRARFTTDFESSTLDQYSNQTMVCVNNDLGHGICQGDSGGPLYCDRMTPSGERCTEVYGVASFIIQYATVGAMCAVENLPGIFGEVSSKTEWISSTMKMFEQTYRLKYS